MESQVVASDEKVFLSYTTSSHPKPTLSAHNSNILNPDWHYLFKIYDRTARSLFDKTSIISVGRYRFVYAISASIPPSSY